jgi:hypothetical protein
MAWKLGPRSGFFGAEPSFQAGAGTVVNRHGRRIWNGFQAASLIFFGTVPNLSPPEEYRFVSPFAAAPR